MSDWRRIPPPAGEAGPGGQAEKTEVAQAKHAFLAAIAHARQQQEQAPGRLAVYSSRSGGQRAWRLALSAAAVAVFGTVIGLMVMLPGTRLAEALSFRGFHGFVINELDGKPVANVKVAEIDNSSGAPRTVAWTDAAGMFYIPPDENGTQRKYGLFYSGEPLNKYLYMGPSEGLAEGIGEIAVKVEPQRLVQYRDISLKPGGEQEVFSGVILGLSAAADKPWRGRIYYDQDWPTNFIFSQVLDGIFRIEGPQTLCLELKLKADLDQLRSCGIPDQVLALPVPDEAPPDAAGGDEAVTAGDETASPGEEAVPAGMAESLVDYLKVAAKKTAFGPEAVVAAGKPAPLSKIAYEDGDSMWRAKQHRGWSDTTQSYGEAYLMRTRLAVERGEAATWVKLYPVVPGYQYALMARPAADGEALAAFLDSQTGKEDHCGVFLVSGFTTPQPYLYDMAYYDPAMKQWYEAGGFLDIYRTPYLSTYSPSLRGHGIDELRPPIMPAGAYRAVPGMVELMKYDFTIEDHISYLITDLDFSTAPQEYDIEFTHAGAGTVCTMRLTGPLLAVAGAPEWDMYCDGVIDSYGFDAQLLLDRPGAYNIRALVRERNGNNVIVQRTLALPGPGIAGYYQDCPVLEASAAPPQRDVTLAAFSAKAVRSSTAYGAYAGFGAGPFIAVKPPREWGGTKLKSLRLVFYASPLGGDTGEMPMIADCYNMRMNGPDLQPWVPDETTMHPEYGIQMNLLINHQIPWIAHNALDKVEREGTAEAVFGSLYSYLRTDDGQFDETTAIRLNAVLGLDMGQPPPASEVVRRLTAYLDTDYNTVTYITQPHQEVDWLFDLWGLPADNEVLMVRIGLSDMGFPLAGQWQLHSGPGHPCRVELTAMDGRTLKQYIDYSPVAPQFRDYSKQPE